MAKKKVDVATYVEEPKADVYLAIMILTFVAMIIATFLMYLEWAALQG
ncbi:hypothetical protein K2X85_05685 [bacterium]|jgi:hypothetical protein|nr:hypothetical protein [bacterium]